MSSFLIDKVEFIKAAGFLAGLADSKNYHREPALRVYDCDLHKVLEKSDYIDLMLLVYNASLVSLGENDTDGNNYSSEFINAFSLSKRYYLKAYAGLGDDDRVKLEKSIYSFNHFCDSVLYQIDNCKENDKAFKILSHINYCLMKLLADLKLDEDSKADNWGEFNF